MEDLDEEEDDTLKNSEVQTPVPQTPDQEAFLKKHFANLSDLNTAGMLYQELIVCVCFKLVVSHTLISLSSKFNQSHRKHLWQHFLKVPLSEFSQQVRPGDTILQIFHSDLKLKTCPVSVQNWIPIPHKQKHWR